MEKLKVTVAKEHFYRILETVLEMSGSDINIEEVESLTFIPETND